MSVSVATANRIQHGEGPCWDESTSSLLYVDEFQGAVQKLNTITQQESRLHVGETVSFVIPRSNGNGYVISFGRNVCTLDWDTAKRTKLCEVGLDDGCQNALNDGKCDASGRLWAGTMGHFGIPGQFESLEKETSSLYSFAKNYTVRKHLDKISVSNGLAWTLDNTVMYYIDSIPRKVYAFDFDVTNGTPSNQRTAIDFSEGTEDTLGFPDGMSIDQDDKIWVACFGSGKVIRFDVEKGAQLQTVSLPAKNITSCCFGGPSYTDLYVTTSRWGLTEEELMKYPLSGSVFKVTELGVRGSAAATYDG